MIHFLRTSKAASWLRDALDKPSDPVHLRRAMDKLIRVAWQATQEGRAALNSLRTLDHRDERSR